MLRNQRYNRKLSDCQEKKKQLESERHNIELTSPFTSSMEVKAVTRKLRRRPNEPAPVPNEKRRKASPTQINFVLADEDIANDLKVVSFVIFGSSFAFKLQFDFNEKFLIFDLKVWF